MTDPTEPAAPAVSPPAFPTMTVDEVAARYPFVAEADRQTIVDLYAAKGAFEAALTKIAGDRADISRMFLQQTFGIFNSAVQILPQA